MCIQQHRNDTLEPLYDPRVCVECSPAYDRLNNIYNGIKASTGDSSYCMDILDLVSINMHLQIFYYSLSYEGFKKKLN